MRFSFGQTAPAQEEMVFSAPDLQVGILFIPFGKDVSESSIAASRKRSNSDYLYCDMDMVLEVPGKKGLFPNS